MEEDTTTAFYDGLAEDYHHIYADWEASIHRQAAALDRLIAAELGPGQHRILDCTCGIGTQALGLAALGHDLTGADVSPRAIERARRESRRRGLPIRFLVADVRSLTRSVEGDFDVVLSADNALPHLLSDSDLRLAVRNMVSLIRPDGLFLASIRDYDAVLADPPKTTTPVVRGPAGARHITFQSRDWKADGQTYDLEMFVLLENAGSGWEIRVHRTRYRAVTRAVLGSIMEEEGIPSPSWAMPDATGFFQPIARGRRREAPAA